MATAGLGGLPGFTGFGDPQGGQQSGGSPTQNLAEISPQNPSQTDPEQGYFSTGKVTPDDQKIIVETISEYRNSWSQDRLERIRQWMENLFYWKGIQVIRWDTATNLLVRRSRLGAKPESGLWRRYRP